MQVADHEPRLIGAPLPRLGDRDVGRLARAHHLARDLTPSLGRYPPPTRALEHGEELAVRVAEAGSDPDRHRPRIRPAAGASAEIGNGVDVERQA